MTSAEVAAAPSANPLQATARLAWSGYIDGVEGLSLFTLGARSPRRSWFPHSPGATSWPRLESGLLWRSWTQSVHLTT